MSPVALGGVFEAIVAWGGKVEVTACWGNRVRSRRVWIRLKPVFWGGTWESLGVLGAEGKATVC